VERKDFIVRMLLALQTGMRLPNLHMRGPLLHARCVLEIIDRLED